MSRMLRTYDIHKEYIVIRKEIKFDDNLAKSIQEYADLFYEGNFNMAVRQLAFKGLKVMNKFMSEKVL